MSLSLLPLQAANRHVSLAQPTRTAFIYDIYILTRTDLPHTLSQLTHSASVYQSATYTRCPALYSLILLPSVILPNVHIGHPSHSALYQADHPLTFPLRAMLLTLYHERVLSRAIIQDRGAISPGMVGTDLQASGLLSFGHISFSLISSLSKFSTFLPLLHIYF